MRYVVIAVAFLLGIFVTLDYADKKIEKELSASQAKLAQEDRFVYIDDADGLIRDGKVSIATTHEVASTYLLNGRSVTVYRVTEYPVYLVLMDGTRYRIPVSTGMTVELRSLEGVFGYAACPTSSRTCSTWIETTGILLQPHN